MFYINLFIYYVIFFMIYIELKGRAFGGIAGDSHFAYPEDSHLQDDCLL